MLLYIHSYPYERSSSSSCHRYTFIHTYHCISSFTLCVQAIIPESIELCKSNIDEAINLCFLLEKKCRINNDITTLKALCLHMIRLCKDNSDWIKLNSTLAVIHKRRAQSKHAIQVCVNEAYTYLDTVSWPTIDTKVELIKTLKDICDGKIYVEAESARLHLMLALILESKGDVAGACDMIQDVHVETYGSLTKKEKAEYILEQIRLNLLKKDYIRALIQSRKMNRTVIEEEGYEQIKVKYYTMMVEYHTHGREIWDICQAYYKIFDTKTLSDDKQLLASSLESCIIFLLLSPFDNHQSDMMHRLKLLKNVEQLPVYMNGLTLFTTHEIIPYPFDGLQDYESHASLHAYDGVDAMVYYKKLMQTRIIEHNLRVVSKYYRRIHNNRLSAMLNLNQDLLEEHLSSLSNNEGFYVKIDRPAGIINFHAPRHAEAVLSDWAGDVDKMLSLMESTCHLINRENMVHNL